MDTSQTTPPSDTGEQTTPEPVPYDRFKEVNEKAKAEAQARVEAEERARKAEDAWRTSQSEMTSLKRLVEERLPAPKPEPDEWQDPVDVHAREIAELKAWKRDREEEAKAKAEVDADRRVIDEAIRKAGIEDVGTWGDEVAKAYFASKHLGLQFDADSTAARYRKLEQAAQNPAENNNIERARQAAATNTSVITGNANAGSPAPEPPPSRRPNRLDPDWSQESEDKWVQEQTQAILAKHRR